MALADKIMQWLRLPRLAQSAPDTLTTVEVKLPTEPEIGMVLLVHEIDFMAFGQPMIDGSWMQMTLATQNGIPMGDLRYDNEHVIDLHEVRASLLTSGGGLMDVNYRHLYPKPIMIAHPSLWVYATSALTTMANVFNGRMGFTFAKISAQEFWQALARYGG